MGNTLRPCKTNIEICCLNHQPKPQETSERTRDTANAIANGCEERTMTKIFTGDPEEDMEIAKRLIAKFPDLDLAELIAIATDQTQPHSARIAAIYTLGFTDDDGLSNPALTRISTDTKEPADVRDYASEAVASMAAMMSSLRTAH